MRKSHRSFITLLFSLCALVFGSGASAQQPLAGLDQQTTKSMRDALVSEAVLIIYGTGASETVTAELLKFSEDLKADLETKMGGGGWPITVRPDSEVSLPELGGCFLFLVGTPASNVILTLYEGSFPLQIDADGVSVGKENYAGDDLAATFAVINPFNPRHYAVVYTGVNDAAIWTAPEFAYEEIGYTVVSGDGVLARGQFDTTIPDYWTILPGASVKQVSDQLVIDADALGLDFKPEEPLNGLADHSLFMLGYGPTSGTVELQAFLLPYLTHLNQQRGVRTVALEAPLWMSSFLDAYAVDGTPPPESLELDEEMATFIEELRTYNKGLSADKKIHVATFDLNHDVFAKGGAGSLLPLKTWIGQLKDRETRKELSSILASAEEAFAGGNPAVMLQAINLLNEAVAVAALKKKVPADLFPLISHYLETQKTSIFYHQPENLARRDSASLREARTRILRQNMTDLIDRNAADLDESPILFFLAADHCNKGAPGTAYSRIPLAQYFDKYYEPTWERVHVVVAQALSGGWYDETLRSKEVIDAGYTPDEFEALIEDFRQPNSLVFVEFDTPFWVDNRLTINHIWTWPAQLYDGMVFFFDVQPASGTKVSISK